jgi:hypothetical protein
MTAPTVLSVTLDVRDATSSATQRSILASVPGHFRITENPGADVVVVSGRNSGWPDGVVRVIHDGARGVLVVRPGLIDPDRVRELSDAVAGRAVVAVDTPYATDRTWTAVENDVAVDAVGASIVDSVVSVPGGTQGDDLVGALLDQLAVVRPLVSLVDRLRLAHRGEGNYVLAAQARGPRVTLTGVTSAAGRAALALDVVAPSRRWQVRFDDTALARPTEITLHDETGAHTRPLTYESGRRVTWQRLHEALTENGEVGYSLDHLADDLELVRRVRWAD